MYYALTAKKETGAPLSLEGIGILYENFPFDKSIDYGYFPWYGYDTKNECHLPEGGVLFYRKGVCDFLIRKLSSNIYVVSDVFMKAALKLNQGLHGVPLRVLDKNGQCVSKRSYFLMRIPRVDFYEVVDVDKSDFYEQDGWIVLNKISIKESCKIPLFLIEGVDLGQKTVIISREFLSQLKGGGKGVDFFEVDKALWPNVDDILGQSLSEKGVVWPI